MSKRDDEAQRPRACPYRDESGRFSSPTTPDNHSVRPERSLNPFIAFKQFVDEQFSAIVNLPSSIPELRRRMQAEAQERQQREQAAYWAWTGREASSDHDEMLVQRMSRDEKDDAVDSALHLLHTAEQQFAHVDPAKIQALYRDDEASALEYDRFAGPMLSFGGACYYMPETGDNLPSSASLFGRWPAPTPRWLSIDWFKNSAYSPLQLERFSARSEKVWPQERFRAAFEDLLCETLGTGAIDEEERLSVVGTRNTHGSRQRISTGPGLDWMLSLQCRGILPPQIPSWYNEGNRSGGAKLGITGLQRLDSVQYKWWDMRGHWGKKTAEMEFAELIREIATPPAAPLQSVTPSQSLDLFAGLDEMFIPTGSRSSSSRTFWERLDAWDTDGAAEVVERWERRGGDARGLIGDDEIVEDLLNMATDPSLWPLCEALEKADSRLLVEQSPKLNEDRGQIQARTWPYETQRVLDKMPIDDAVPSEKRLLFEAMIHAVLQTQRHAEERYTWADDDSRLLSPRSPEQQWLDEEAERACLSFVRYDNPSEEVELTPMVRNGVPAFKGYLEKLQRAAAAKKTEGVTEHETAWSDVANASLEEWITQQPHVTPKDAFEHQPRQDEKSETRKEVGVLAALTTTQTTREPDGTVTTRVVLKKRFSDGREETTESLQVEKPEQKKVEEEAKTDRGGKGWFWK